MKVAAIVDDLTPSQSSYYMIKSFNKLDGPICFYENISGVSIPANFSIMNIAYLPHFSGAVFSTTINSARRLLDAPINSRNFLYLWDLSWLKEPSIFTDDISVLRNPRLTLLARSDEHKAIIQNYCNRDLVEIVDNWNSEQIKELIK